MRLFVFLALAALTGCADTIFNVGDGGCPTCPFGFSPAQEPAPTPVQAQISNLFCSRVEGTGGASRARISWSGTMPLTIVATNMGGVTSSFSGATSPAVLDPGPPGAGAGAWTFDLAGLASCQVTLDS